MEKLKNILRMTNMSTRPEFYSGRGATLSDLDSKMLESIYLGIVKDYGQFAGEGFIHMVNNIKVLSATCFLNELYNLYYLNWKYQLKSVDESGIAVSKNAEGEYNLISGLMGISTYFLNVNRDDTQRIKSSFLAKHGIKPKEIYYEDGNIIEYRY